MSYGGLRGAVAFALALLIKEKRVESQPMFVTTTIAVIYFTVFVQGITIKPLVKILNVKRANKKKPTMNERIHERVSYLFMSDSDGWCMFMCVHDNGTIQCLHITMIPLFSTEIPIHTHTKQQLIDHLMAGVEDIVGKTGNYNVRDKFKRFDQKFIRPLVLKHIQVRDKKKQKTFFSLLFLLLITSPYIDTRTLIDTTSVCFSLMFFFCWHLN